MSTSSEIEENEVDKAVSTRFSCMSFSEKQIEKGLLDHILKLTQRTPTGCNLQNYRIITVRNPEIIEKVREAHIEFNAKISQNAIPVIFLTDLQPSLSIPDLAELQKREGKPDSAMDFVKSFMSYLMKENWYDSYKTIIGSAARWKMNVPASMDAFSYGETSIGLVVSTFVTLCTSHGIDTHIMQAFADWKLHTALNIPSRFHPTIVVWCGYRSKEPTKRSMRYDSEHILFEDTFGNPLIK